MLYLGTLSHESAVDAGRRSAMVDVDKRAFVADLYPSRRWKQKVTRMSDAQVTAIYLREQAKIQSPQQDKPKEDGDNDIPF
jgi:hypothetical protein